MGLPGQAAGIPTVPMTERIRIVADAHIPFLRGVLEPYADVRYLPAAEIRRESIQGSAALLIRTRTKCDAWLLDGSRIVFIGTATIGHDHIDTAYCEANRIRWVHAPGCNASSVAQYIASALLTMARKKGLDLARMTIGIVGVGHVGGKVAGLARSLGMRVLLNDPPRMRAEGRSGFVDLDALLSESDLITFHVPLTREGVDATYHLADERLFARLKQGTFLLNTSRGPVVASRALKAAIRTGVIGTCVLDVWENEPDVDPELVDMVDLATPHIAGYSADGKANGTATCVRAISSFFHWGGTQDWYPSEIPPPDRPRELVLDGGGKTLQEVVSEAVLAAYTVAEDDDRFRRSVGLFEKLRNEYPVRREFPFFGITLLQATEKTGRTLRDLGFRILRGPSPSIQRTP